MASIAEVSVTVLPSEPVDTTSFYKNVHVTSTAWVSRKRERGSIRVDPVLRRAAERGP